MMDSDITHDSMLPLSWIPTRGNDIPPCAVPALEGQYGPLYIARAFVDGEMQLGTTSHISIGGARIIDHLGRKHVILEYDVLVCAMSLRWEFSEIVDTPMSSPFMKSTRVPMRSPLRQASTSFPDTQSPLNPPSVVDTPKLQPQGSEVFSPIDQPRVMPGSSDEKKYPIDPPPYSSNSDSPQSDWVDVPSNPSRLRPNMINERESVQFEHLVRSHCFVLIDDTLSMQCRWSQARDSLAGVADILSWDKNWQGADVRFLHHPDVHRGVRTPEEFNGLLNSVTIRNANKAMGVKVMQVFLDGLALVQQTAQPLNLLIITDGIPPDTHLFDKIIRFSQQLDQQRVQSHMFRIHILQMGDDRTAVQPLHDFRDRIAKCDNDRHLLNIVSYHRARGLLNAQTIMKLLLASTYIPNEEDPDVPQRLPPTAIKAQYAELDRIRAMGNSRR